MGELARIVESIHETMPLATRFSTNTSDGGKLSIMLADVLGHTTGRQWISDVVLFFVLTHALRHRPDVYVLDPQVASSTFTPPSFDIRLLKYIVYPVIIIEYHWGVMILEFDWDVEKTTVSVYDPQNNPGQREYIRAVFESETRGHIDRWYARDHSGLPTGEAYSKAVRDPMQQDGHNCGFFCVVAVMCVVEDFKLNPDFVSYVTVADGYTTPVATTEAMDLEALRLRILHLIFSSAVAPTVEEQGRLKLLETKLEPHLPKTS